MESNNRNLLKSHLRVIPKPPKTRNQRFKEALIRNHSKIKRGGPASTDKKVKELNNRKLDIQSDPDRLELLNWIIEIRAKLGYTREQFGRILGVSSKTVQNWELKVGYMPTLKTFRRLLQVEKLTRASIVIKKNKNYKVKEIAATKVVIN